MQNIYKGRKCPDKAFWEKPPTVPLSVSCVCHLPLTCPAFLCAFCGWNSGPQYLQGNYSTKWTICPTFICPFYFLCVCMVCSFVYLLLLCLCGVSGQCVDVPQCACGGHRTVSWGQFSALSFHRLQGLNWRYQVSLTKQFYVPSHLAVPRFWFCFKTRSHTVWASLELAIFSWEYPELLILLPLPSIRVVDVCYHTKVCFYFLFYFILFLRQSLAI